MRGATLRFLRARYRNLARLIAVVRRRDYFVAANGRVTDSKVESSSGVPRLDDAAIRCVTREGRFKPQRNGGAAVGSRQRMKYTWRLAS